MHQICSRIGRGSWAILLLVVLAVFGGACGGGAGDATTSQPAATAAPVTTQPTVQESASAEPTSDSPSGIVAFFFDGDTSTSAELTLIDPSTGTATPWRTFDAESAGIPTLRLESFPQTLEVANRLGLSIVRYVFSEDYSRMAATSVDSNDGSEHVGWLTTDGEFVDVTAAVNAGQSDFADAPQDTGPSFGKDDLFYWYDDNESKYKRIDPSGSLEPSAVEVISKDEVCGAFGLKNLDDKKAQYVYDSVYVSDRGLYATGGFADWIDGKRYLDVDYGIGVGEATASPTADAPPVKEVLPSSNRANWNPIADPGGEQFAFLSSNPNQSGIELFIESINGGEPTRVDTDYDFTQTGSYGTLLDSDSHPLLDWL